MHSVNDVFEKLTGENAGRFLPALLISLGRSCGHENDIRLSAKI
jgi:hypothetical protein